MALKRDYNKYGTKEGLFYGALIGTLGMKF